MQTEQVLTPTAPPLISFIVTTCDLPADMLRECMESIGALALSENEREIILVDDGSQESPLNGLEDWKDRIVYLRQQNQGLSVARNNGLRMARGEYIQFIDGDDRLLTAPYNQCLDLARQRDADVVMFSLTRNPRPGQAKPLATMATSGISYLHNHNLRGSACGYLFRKKTLSELRFTPGRLHEDEEFTPLLLLRAEKVIDTRAEAYFYRTRATSITHKADSAHNSKRLSDTEAILISLQDTASRLPEAERVALKRRIAQLTMDFLYQTARLTRSTRQLEAAIGRLKAKGLYPLPASNYTPRYTLFRQMVGSSIGRRLLVGCTQLSKP